MCHQRCQPRTGLFRHGNRLPSLFIGDGVAVWYDPAHPGELRIMKGVLPVLSVRCEEASLQFQMAATEEPRNAQVMFDFGSFIIDPMEVVDQEYDALRGALVIGRDHSETSILIAPKGHTFAVRSLKFASHSGKLVDVEEIRVGAEASTTLFVVTEKTLRAAGLNIKDVTADDADAKGKFPQAGEPPAQDADLLEKFAALFQAGAR